MLILLCGLRALGQAGDTPGFGLEFKTGLTHSRFGPLYWDPRHESVFNNRRRRAGQPASGGAWVAAPLRIRAISRPMRAGICATLSAGAAIRQQYLAGNSLAHTGCGG